jgi:hypothetical protein
MKSRDYFDRISIINLPERSDRRAEMLKELDSAGLSLQPGRIEFFPAVKVSDAAEFDNAGYHGCFRSHLGVFRQARTAGASKLLVFEDDAAIARRFQQDEEALIDQLCSMEWGIVYFGHALEATADRPTQLKPYRDGVRLSHFYAVNGKYLDRLIDFFEKILTRPAGHPDGGPMSPDGALHFFLMKNPDIPCHVASPNLGTQRSSRSDVSPKWFDHVPVLNRTIAALRKVKRWLKKT